MTTAALVQCPFLPPTGLLTSMHHPDVPLDWKEIFASPAISGDDDPYGIPITLGLITKCISRVHGDALYQVFKDRPTLHPTIPHQQLFS